MNYEYALLAGALKTFHDFSGDSATCNFTYDHGAPGFSELLSKYPVREAAGNGNETQKALNLLNWCAQNVLHNGGTKDVEFIPKTSVDILNYAYQKGQEYGVYCRLQAIVFAECCLALGIKARILHCLPFSPYDFETHVVTIVYDPSLKKWVLMDPGNNQFFMDENGMLLSPLEVRERLANDAYVKYRIENDYYKQYMAKNLFYFKSPQYNTFGSDLQENQKTIYCVPKGFDVLGREIAYCEHAIKNSPPHLVDSWKTLLDEFRERSYFINISAEQFFS